MESFLNKLKITLHESEIFPMKDSGSDCKFYRIKWERPAIILFFDSKHKNFDSYVSINNFLRKIGIGVPEIYYCDKDKKFVIEEDLGDMTLQKKLQSIEQQEELFDIYKQVIDTLVIMQILGKNRINECPVLNNKIFNYDMFRWETSYFKQYFIELYCKIKIDNELDYEFHKLAMKLVDEPIYFMHRDFQSSNILIKDNKIRIVDYQGAHQGLLQYDLVSLLKDSYFDMGDKLRKKLIFYYIDLLKQHEIKVNENEFIKTFFYTGLQRHMQALGAFSYLSLIKGKKEYQKYIPSTLNYIKYELSEISEFPRLNKLFKSII